MKKLLFITNESSHGGAEKMLIWLANNLSTFPDYSVLFCILNNNKPFYSLSDAIKIISLSKPSNENFIYRNTIGFLKKTLFVYRIIKIEKIDMIINFNDHALYNILVCKALLKVKLLISQRVDPGAIVSKTGKFRLKLIKYADGLVCQTQQALDFFSESIQKKSVVIFNPIYNIPETLWNPQKTHKTIISVARLELKQKRQDVLIKAFKIVHEKVPDIKLLMYGSKIEKDYQIIKNLINELELNEYVKYCGITSDIFSEMRKAKMLVLSSDYEGIPNSILEAMALGMPIISTDCKPGGARMLLNDNGGLLVPCGDIEALANAILFLLQNPSIGVEKAKIANRSIDRFNEKSIANQWHRYIQQII